MKDRLSKLLTVKSMVTMILTVVFSILALRQIVDDETFLTIYTMIISFYFGTQHEKTSVKEPTATESKGDQNA